jgi:hypothetical protein
LPAFEHENWPGHFGMLAGHAGGERYVVVQGKPQSWSLQAHGLDPSAAALAEVALGEVVPAALHHVDEQVFVGQGDAVAYVDLRAAKPTRVELRKRPEMRFKAYDLFVRSGAWLLAIDDQVFPIYADGFRLDGPQPVHVHDWELPGAINGHYSLGVLIPSGPADGILYVGVDYGIMDGHGHDLAALPIRAGKLEVGSDVILNSGSVESPPVLEEHVDRGTKQPTKLIAGSEYTDWHRLEYLPDGVAGEARLLIAAGARGLLELTPNFGPQTKAELLEVGGEVSDLLVDAGRVWALVSPSDGAGKSELVEVVFEARGGGHVERRVPLPERFDRIVH